MHSLVDAIDTNCISCGAPFEAKIWLIIDAEERPDLVERARQGKLNINICPICGADNPFIAPLLLFQPRAIPHLLFFPLPGWSEEENWEQFDQLLDELRDAMGEEWKHDWLQFMLMVPKHWSVSEVLGEGGMGSFLADIARTFFRRYEQDGDATDLLKAIRYWQASIEKSIADPAKLAARLNDLGNGVMARYERNGDLSDLHLAISYWEQAIETAPEHAPDLPGYLANLGNGWVNHFYLTGHTEDLNKAVSLYRQAIAATPADSVSLGDFWNNLGTGLHARYEKTGSISDLDAAINAYQRARDLMPPGSPSLPFVLTNLGSCLRDRYHHPGHEQDLEKSIILLEEALDLTRSSSPYRAMRMNNLGTALADQYERSGHQELLEKALKCWMGAIEITAEDNIDSSLFLNNLAGGLIRKLEVMNDDALWEEAIQYLERAVNHLEKQGDVFPGTRYTVAKNLGNLHHPQQHWPEARRAYEQAAQAANQLHLGSITQEAMKHLARQNADLYARLVHSCLKVGDETAALTHIFASQGRALADMIASHPLDMDALPPELRDRIGTILDLGERIRAIERQQPLGNVDKRTSLHATLERLRQQEADAWRALQRDYPEFFRLQAGDPLTLPQAQILAGELDATLVGYYRHTGGWLAYVIPPHAGEPILIPLDTLDDHHLSQLLRATYYRLDRCPQQTWRRLRDMYARLLAPLQAYLPAPDPSHPSKLVLVPFGPLHFLPLSAMILDDEALDGSWHLNEAYIVGIVPNLSVLRRMLEKAQTHSERDRLLAVAYSDPQGPLTLHRVDAEVRAVAAHFPSGSVPPLSEAEATTGRVIAAAPQAHVLHFACHGRFHPDPNQAGLRLADGWLRVLDIIYRLRLDQTSLVTLSACETGRVQVDAGDELAGLNLAFMHAGAAAVLASLWPVDDHATERLFHHFYTHYRAGRSVAASLSAAQSDLRREGFHHPFHWAAFQPTGMVF